MSIRCVGIHWNSSKPSGLDVARKLIELLSCKGVEICLNSSLSAQLKAEGFFVDEFYRCQLLIVLGGDGTILSGLDRAIPYDIPILGINLGRLGFLTEIETDELDERIIDRLLAEDYAIDARTTMTIEGQDHLRYFALNDIVIARATPSVRILSLEYEANGTLVDCISGDGLIVATATVSTAYSLSAGGDMPTHAETTNSFSGFSERPPIFTSLTVSSSSSNLLLCMNVTKLSPPMRHTHSLGPANE